MSRFPDQGVALVIGGSGGIGAAIARMLATRGSNVAVTWRGNEKSALAVAAAVTEWGTRSSAHHLDVESAQECAAVVEVGS